MGADPALLSQEGRFVPGRSLVCLQDRKQGGLRRLRGCGKQIPVAEEESELTLE